MSKDEILKHIHNFLQDKYQMVIATSDDHPWIATVYFAFDENLNLYFLSNPGTLHCKQIIKNPHVAIAISDSPQEPSKAKKGIQVYGLAERISDESETRHAIKLWTEALDVTSEDYSYEGMNENKIDGRMYIVQPKKIKFFNQELWEEGEEPTVEL